MQSGSTMSMRSSRQLCRLDSKSACTWSSTLSIECNVSTRYIFCTVYMFHVNVRYALLIPLPRTSWLLLRNLGPGDVPCRIPKLPLEGVAIASAYGGYRSSVILEGI